MAPRSPWGERYFFLIDVGASGGVGCQSEAFGDRLRAVDFDPLLAEAESAAAAGGWFENPLRSGFVTCRDFDALFPPEIRHDRVLARAGDAFWGVSALRAHQLMRMNYVEQVFNAGAPAQYTDPPDRARRVHRPNERESVDFIKSTRMATTSVLLGTDELLRDGGVLVRHGAGRRIPRVVEPDIAAWLEPYRGIGPASPCWRAWSELACSMWPARCSSTSSTGSGWAASRT